MSLTALQKIEEYATIIDMQHKLGLYCLVFVLSFSFFTILFQNIADAQVPEEALSQTPAVPLKIKPTPSVFAKQVAAIKVTPTATPTPSPTMTPTPLPTATPTPTPTATPTPTPTATPTLLPTIAVVTDLESLFSKYSSQYSVDENQLKRIASCESGFNANAENGPYIGMFQFAEQTWITWRAQMGLDTNADLRRNAEESIRTAAYMISKGQASAWGCK